MLITLYSVLRTTNAMMNSTVLIYSTTVHPWKFLAWNHIKDWASSHSSAKLHTPTICKFATGAFPP